VLMATAKRYAPYVRLHPDDQYRPCTVDVYLQKSQLMYPNGTPIRMANGQTTPVDPTVLNNATPQYYLQVVDHSVDNGLPIQVGAVSGVPAYVHIVPIDEPGFDGCCKRRGRRTRSRTTP